MCCTLNVHMVNGRFNDVPGNFTCITHSGKSVVDYIVVDSLLYALIENFEVLCCTDSDHLPVTCSIEVKINSELCENNNKRWIRHKWKPNKEMEFLNKFNEPVAIDCVNKTNYAVDDNDIEGAVHWLTALFHYCGKTMVVHPPKQNNYQPEWWDYECDQSKHEKNKKLRIFRQSRSEQDFLLFKESKCKFKNLCSIKESQYNPFVTKEF